MNHYRCIMLDCPWPETGGGKVKRGADRHYPVMRRHEILATILRARIPKIGAYVHAFRPDPAGCHVWMWATKNHILDAFWILDALGTRYVTMLTWGKCERVRMPPSSADLHGVVYRKQRAGLGQYAGGLTEFLLLGVIGRLGPQVRKKIDDLVLAPRTSKHSQKPEEMRRRIEIVSPGPRLEMFARERVKGWDAWGNEV